jgi:predicted DNA-binding transcriptional regulator AlpA
VADARVPVVGLGMLPDPERWLSWDDVAKKANVSQSTAKRMVAEGALPRPTKRGKRKVGFKQGEVDLALEKREK